MIPDAYPDKLFDREVEENLRLVQERLQAAARRNCTLLLATKTVSPRQINMLARRSGVTLIGENRVQELCDKYPELDTSILQIHFIGHLQTNKVRQIIDKVSMIHSLDRMELAMEINRRAETKNLRMDVLCEINSGREATKGGLLPEEAEEFVREVARLPHLRVRGLMTMAPRCETEPEYAPYFSETAKLFERLAALHIEGTRMDTLSMGMSDSFEAAARCGANMVRVGGAVFGRRAALAQGV